MSLFCMIMVVTTRAIPIQVHLTPRASNLNLKLMKLVNHLGYFIYERKKPQGAFFAFLLLDQGLEVSEEEAGQMLMASLQAQT
jgi:hypothetical protein